MPLPILVTGATGQVGGAVARALLDLGAPVRALVRDPSKASARALQNAGAELVRADFADAASLRAAATGTRAVFLVTTPNGGVEAEAAHGMAMVDAAVAAGVDRFVYSSVADAQNRTGIPHFESKWVVEQHLATTSLAWTVVAPVYFYENLLFPWNRPALAAGRWSQPLPADVPLQMIALGDIGRFAAHVLLHPDGFLHRHVDIAGESLTGDATAAVLGAAIGRPVAYDAQPLAAAMAMSEDMGLMYGWFADVGYSVDIPALHREVPEVPWTSFAAWAQGIDWATLLSP